MINLDGYNTFRRELITIRIDLDADPANSGIGSLNEKIAAVHALKERVSTILSEAIANVYERERIYQELRVDYERKFDSILVSDPQIQNLKSEGLRKAACNSKLPDEFAKVNSASIDLAEAESFQKIVQNKYNLLDSANMNISRQISVIQLQLDIGEIARGTGAPFKARTLGVKKPWQESDPNG